jgi:outer membrane protein assembly factor BamB
LNKDKGSTVAALLLMFAMAFSLIALPAAIAHDPPWSVKTYAYLEINPDPVGVGQTAYVSFGIDKVPQTVSGAYGDRWTNFEIEVTQPDGHIQTLTGFTADDTGFAYTTYVPATTGNYTFVLTFGGQTLVGANPPPGGFRSSQAAHIGDYYEPSTSHPMTLYVQDEPATMLPGTPLPTEYWQRPINMMNNIWNTISGNWLGTYAYVNAGLGYNSTSNFDPYTTAPNTAHILWTTPLAPGGLIGGEYGDTAHSNFYSTAQYECKFLSVIINGVLYYTYTPISSSNKMGTIAQDLRTGEILWHRYDMNSTLYCGQVYNYISPNQYGGLAYLWTRSGGFGGTGYWSMYDAATGNWILDIVDAQTSGMLVSSPEDGSLLQYYINYTDNTLNLWNSSRCILVSASGTGDPNGWSWRPRSGAIPFEYGIEWSAPIATEIDGNPIRLSFSGGQSNGNIGITGDAIILAQMGGGTGSWINWEVYAGYSLTDGHQMFLINNTVSAWSKVVSYSINDGRFVQMVASDAVINCFSASTGQKLWTAAFPDNNLWVYLAVYRPVSAYGLMYSSTFDGHCYAWNDTTGELVWDWYAGNAGLNTVYNSWPVKTIELVADGKVFLNGGHTYNPPMFRGSHAYALNATTGEEVWSILSFCESNSPVVAAADGTVLMPKAYDNLLYAYGKGRSATTVEAPLTAITNGDSVVIRGTVTDQSPGQTCLGIPAAGTPAIADVYMSHWMEYLYEQQPRPSNATGVEVTVSVLDPNSNVYDVGTTTSNADGTYGLTFTPPVPGLYEVIATFAGSESYYSSHAATYLSVVEAPAASPSPTPMPASMADLYFIPSVIGIIVAIVVVGVVIILMQRKR